VTTLGLGGRNGVLAKAKVDGCGAESSVDEAADDHGQHERKPKRYPAHAW
jgi:hypothetical protein